MREKQKPTRMRTSLPAKPPPAPIVETRTPLALAADVRANKVRELQDRVYLKAMTIVDATMDYAEVTPDQETPPEEWVAKYGQREAEERLRMAKYGLMSAKEAPVASKIAMTVMAGIMKIQAAKEGGTKILNAQVMMMPSTSDPLPRVVTTEGEDA